MVNFGVHHLPLPGGAPAPKKPGSLPPPSPLPCGAPTRRVRRGHAGPAPYCALLRRTRGIRANPPPIRLSRQSSHHSGEGCAL